MPADVFFVAGEASGDAQAALLARALRELRPNLSFGATGGDALRAAGARLLVDSTSFAGIGPISVWLMVPRLYAAFLRTERTLRAHPPRLLVPLDSGAINLRLLARLRRRGYASPVVYYFPPGAWLDDPETARRTAALATPLTAFAHQRDFYARLGLPIEYFGHPLSSVIAPRPVAGRSGRIAVMPGSRREEIERHIGVLASAAAALSASGVMFRIVAASHAAHELIRRLWRLHGGPETAEIVRGPVADAVSDVDLAWTASGTAVLETALRGAPQVAFYAVSAAQYRIALRRIPQIVAGHITLPNLILGREVIAELKQSAFTPQRLLEQTRLLLDDDAKRTSQLDAYAELRDALGPPDALARIAAYMLDRLEGRPR